LFKVEKRIIFQFFWNNDSFDIDHHLRRLIAIMRFSNYIFPSLTIWRDASKIDTSEPYEFCNCQYCRFDVVDLPDKEFFKQFKDFIAKDFKEILHNVTEELKGSEPSEFSILEKFLQGASELFYSIATGKNDFKELSKDQQEPYFEKGRLFFTLLGFYSVNFK